MAGNPITEAEVEQIRRHHAAGLSLNATAKALGRPVTTVRRAALKAGLSWDRTRTEAAVKAAALDFAARRVLIQQRYLEIAEELQLRAVAEAEHAQPAGADGEVRRWKTKRPEPREVADLLRAATAATNAELRLADYKQRDNHDDAAEIVLSFDVAVRQAYAEQQAEPDA
ncbi:MAG: hypothetical protein YHS30scaffold324_18 [Catenulispora phage 69_17]|jgi:hypothetical protein|nr:MAG: hypothetical protein YHS30scaffold324_18 [Catenulispora phage 69_17]